MRFGILMLGVAISISSCSADTTASSSKPNSEHENLSPTPSPTADNATLVYKGNYSDNDLAGFDVLDLGKIDSSERKVDLKDGRYMQDMFSIEIPKDFYVTNTALRDAVLFKHKTKDFYLYVFAPMYTSPSIFFNRDLNGRDFGYDLGYKIEKIEADEYNLSLEYFFPRTKDNYTRYVVAHRSLEGPGMIAVVAMYKDENDFATLRDLVAGVIDGVIQYWSH